MLPLILCKSIFRIPYFTIIIGLNTFMRYIFSNDFELKLVSLLQYAIFERFFKNSEDIYEFGAGTGHNLLRMREINTQARLHSMEWAKSGVKLLNLVAKAIKDNNLYGMVFDNFNPDHSIKLEPNSSVYTFAALEQLGEDTDKIINFI